MRKLLLTALAIASLTAGAQRTTDVLDRGLVAMKASRGVYLDWRILADEYYGVEYNVYRDGTLVNEKPLSVSNFTDVSGTLQNKYTIAPVKYGKVGTQSKETAPWRTSYMEVTLKHEGIASTLIPNDATAADVDGDGELEIIMKFDNESEMAQAYPRLGPTVNGKVTGEYSIFECFKLDGTRLWWINCGPNMADFQNNEQNIAVFDWDGDGKAEAVMRAADGTVVHMANGKTYTVGNASNNVRAANGGGVNWFVTTTEEYLLYLNGETGEVYDCIRYPLPLLESSETSMNSAWGDGSGHRASKHFFGAPYLDGRKPSIFIGRGIYTRHKMAAYDVNRTTHKLQQRWKWYCNTNGPWKGQGYHNYAIADVDMDGRDEIVFGSMVIDDNGKGLSTTGLGHGDAETVADLNPYVHGLEIYACLEDNPGNNYRDATTSHIYHRFRAGSDDGRAIAGNFTNAFPGGLGCSAREGAISTVTNDAVSGLGATGVNTNFRIYWDGDLCSETFNYLNGKNTEGCVAKYGSWSPIYTMEGSMTNNDTKGTPCFQGDILGDWREEVIMRTGNPNVIRIYSTPTPTTYRIPSLWYDHQYRNAMVWQMNGYNQSPNISYFLGQLEGITVAPPPLTMTGRVEVKDGGIIGSNLDGQHVIVCETANSSVALEQGAQPEVLTFNVPTWVQGTASSESTNQSPKINYTTYSCTVSGGGLAGAAVLAKQGDGVLTLPKADFTHTGGTNVWGGTLAFDGTMRKSALWLNRHTTLASNGGEFFTVKADYGATILPGGADNKGTITADTLSLGFGSRLSFDLYSEGTASDVVKVKVLKIERKTGTAWTQGGPQYLMPVIELNGHLKEGETRLAPGKYAILEFDSIAGSVSNLIFEGISTSKKNVYTEGKKLIVEVLDMRDAGLVAWSGAVDAVWSNSETLNFAIGELNEQTSFVSGDDVVFNDNAERKTVTVTGDVLPASVTVDNTAGYTLQGTGTITGEAQFIKENSGIVTMSGDNSYTGGNHLRGGTVKVSKLSNSITPTGNLGAITSKADLFTIENGATLQSTAAVETASAMKMVGDEGGVISNSADFRAAGVLTGTLLTKKGTGCLFLQKANTLDKIVLNAGSIAIQNNSPAKTIELQGGTLYDDVQATTHAIYVPKGKTASWQLTYTYYTAYNNKLTGEGTLTIVPRNSVSRVRIVGNWTEFRGTIKHTNTNIWLPLDMSTGLPNGTLNIAEGCTVTNVAKTMPIGKLTGKGTLAEPGSNFQNQSAVTGTNTWEVGNDTLGDFTFDGRFVDGGGTNKCVFNKIGSCTMTVSGKSTHTGGTVVKAGTLKLNSGAVLGTGTLAVNSGAMITGIPTLTNSLVTINGTLRPGGYEGATTGSMKFSNKNVTIGDNGVLEIFANRTATSVSNGCANIEDVGKLTINGTILIRPTAAHTLKAGDSIRIFRAASFSGTPKFDFRGGIEWDTSRVAEGLLIVKGVSTGIADIVSETAPRDIYDLRGRKVRSQATTTEGLKPGVYVIEGRKVVVR